MRKIVILCIALLVMLSACGTNRIQEPEICALCDNLPCHAPCIINLSTGEKLELSVYEPHPFTAGELAEEQRGGYFSFIRGAGAEGHKLGGESVTIKIPVKADGLDQQYFCNQCRELLADYKTCGYVLVDLKDTENPVAYEINADLKAAFRCYEISVQEIKEDGKYEISIIGTLNAVDSPETN